MVKYDFSGWATKNDLKCSDGRTIRKNAFKDCDGEVVPLVWSHKEEGPFNVLGHALLENRDEGVYAYGTFNDTIAGQNAKAIVEHGDIKALSIYANHLTQNKGDVLHGKIREVSLVYAGANPGAYIDSVIKHEDTDEEEAVIYTGEFFELHHADDGGDNVSDDSDEKEKEKKKDDDSDDEETVADVLNTLSDKQKTVVFGLIGEAIKESENKKESDDDDENNESKGGDADMKHNIFYGEDQKENVLSHSDQEEIIKMAKTSNIGSLQTALSMYAENNDTLAHGIENIEQLFPDYKDVHPGAPEMLTTDQGWIGKVLAKVHKSPISRIRTRQADLRDIEKLRARGYTKTKEKKYVEDFGILHRTTDPQTVYVKSKIDRDDIIDITDFDVVDYLYKIDRMNLNEELATAIMIGDGRKPGDEGKISEDKIRPIWTDEELYTIHADVDIEKMKKELQGTNTSANFGENYIYAEAIIQALLYARERYKGSGRPDFYCTPHLVNVMLLARDLNGRRIYDNVNELAAALNVNEIITVEQFENRVREEKEGGKQHKLLGIMVNLADYYVGATKGGEITHFTDFDIDFNQEKSLLETRCSGANTRVMSAIALEEPLGKMTGSGKVETVSSSQALLGDNKKVSDLIDGELTVETIGNHTVGVSGIAKQVNNWTAFSTTNNSGHFVPLKLPENFVGQKVTVKGGASDKVIDQFDEDRIMITKIDAYITYNRKQTFEINGEEVLVIDYSDMELAD